LLIDRTLIEAYYTEQQRKKVGTHEFISDLKENNISIADIEEAHLTVEFDMKNFGSKTGPGPEFLCQSFLVSRKNKFSLNYKGENKGINEVIVT